MIQITLLIILILINAFFAATEVSFISINDAKIKKQAENGNKKAKNIAKMLDNPSKFLATIQIGITLAGFLSSAFASDVFASKLAPILYNFWPSLSLNNWNSISIVIITIILSFFTLVLGELVPKRIGMKYCDKVAMATINIVQFIQLIMSPFVKLLTYSTNLISKLFGVTEKEEEIITEEEIRLMVDVGQKKGTINKNEKDMINNIFEFNDKNLEKIMVKIENIVSVNISLTIEEVLSEYNIKEYNHSRIFVYEEIKSNIVGVIYLKDIVVLKDRNNSLKCIMKKVNKFNSTDKIDKVFKKMQKEHIQIALVQDSKFNIIGIFSMEDLIEEILGEIYDEYDKV